MIVQSGQTTACHDADFDPLGGEHIVTNTCPQNYKFTGKERDAESGLDDFDARYYSSALGRFISADWSAVPAPVPYADLGNPQTLNLYGYVKNNPMNLTDPTGHLAVGQLGSADGMNINFRMRAASDTSGFGETDSFSSVNSEEGEAENTRGATQPQQPAQPQQPISGEGSQANLDRRAAIAAAAQAHDGDTSMPYTPGHPTCNLFLQKVVAESGAPKPEVIKADGTKAAPGAAEWAGSKIPNFRILKPGEKPQPGDMAAYKIPNCVDCTGHSGVVVSVGKNGVVGAMAAHPTVIGPDYKFQPGT